MSASAAALSGLLPQSRLSEPVIDIHQHTHYRGRTDDDLIRHQRTLGVSKTVLLPAGSKYGLEADAWGNDSCLALVRKYPREFAFFANEVADLPNAVRVIEKYLKLGAIGIGEQKFYVDCDSPHIHRLAELARSYDVPILMHFQHGTYNKGIERFHQVLEKHPRVNFIGHAQTWWGNIDRQHDQTVMYPKTKVTRGGITDRLLADYPNMFGDLSAGSGLNALLRDEDHAREFLHRHRDKLMYGSDCLDVYGQGDQCSGAQQLTTLRRLLDDDEVRRRILSRNAERLLKLQ